MATNSICVANVFLRVEKRFSGVAGHFLPVQDSNVTLPLVENGNTWKCSTNVSYAIRALDITNIAKIGNLACVLAFDLPDLWLTSTLTLS
ncbi:hypothetical protein L596_010544 [Steinernema carpocapsae]|uniref:Uncharacterized protein n=1 Tax=Steinernema carpocapsae TaxID=34508 RepID=A0A4U5PIN6_STECR|nr:hypothetical protein L596_010544 [Steinernema carpocapsae]